MKCFSPRRISVWLPKCPSRTCSTYSRGGYPKRWVAREHFVLKDLPFYAAVRKEDARARKALLNEREERRQEGTLRKAPGDKRSAPTPPAGAPARKKKKVPSKRKTIKLPTPPKEVVIKSLAPMKGVNNKTSSSLRLAFCFKQLRTYRMSKRIGAFDASG